MAMRIVWALHDSERSLGDTLVALFEAENLVDQYIDQLLRAWWGEMTRYSEETDTLPGQVLLYDPEEVKQLLDIGYDRWRNDQIYGKYPRFTKKRYELWNSTPPNVERLVVHFDT